MPDVLFCKISELYYKVTAISPRGQRVNMWYGPLWPLNACIVYIQRIMHIQFHFFWLWFITYQFCPCSQGLLFSTQVLITWAKQSIPLYTNHMWPLKDKMTIKQDTTKTLPIFHVIYCRKRPVIENKLAYQNDIWVSIQQSTWYGGKYFHKHCSNTAVFIDGKMTCMGMNPTSMSL